MNIINSTNAFRSFYVAGTQPCRSFFSLFKSKYWHGTSEGSIGEEQLNKREFLPLQHNYACLWPTEDKKLATQHALKSASRTNTKPILIQVESDQLLIYPDWGKHSYPAWDTTKAPIKMKKIEVLNMQGEVLRNIE